MKKTFSRKKSAFSLIELSIVLIIIGLLIAGITGGASLIKSSELRSVMGEARGYAVAVNSFYTNYNALPGDYNVAVGNATAGDNNSRIEYYRAASAAGSESASAWVALRTIGAVDTISTATNVIATTAPVYGTTSSATAPASKIKSSGWVFDYRDYTIATGCCSNETSSQNVVILNGGTGTTGIVAGVGAAAVGPLNNASTTATANLSSAAIFAYDALAIDSKVDDGNAGTGKVRGVNPLATVLPTAASTTAATNCFFYASSAFNYNTTDSVRSCALSFQVDVN
jgi:prepilin-type N-terminal cleavage/methylation domain-containing protein